MKVAPLSQSLLLSAERQSSVKIQKSFEQVRSELTLQSGIKELAGPDLTREIAQMVQKAAAGTALPPQELILFQVKAGQFALRVELLSKMAEAGVSTLKKLQNPQ